MPPISLKKVAIALLVIIALSRLDKLLALAAVIWQGIYDSFEPLRNSPPVARRSGVGVHHDIQVDFQEDQVKGGDHREVNIECLSLYCQPPNCQGAEK